MSNYKVKVRNEVESREVQELLFKLNLEKSNWSNSSLPKFIAARIAENKFSDYILSDCGMYKYKEITLPELRAMVHQEQDEPFLTPECTLNDQYAEIERVRKDGLKLDNGKPRHSLLPKGSISSIVAVLEFGAKKYEANNWQKVDNAKDRYYDAAMRHIDSWWNGEKFDQETGIHHLAHAATNLFFLKWFDDKENNNG